MVRVELDRRAIERLVTAPGGALQQGMDRAGRKLSNQTKRNLTSGDTRAVDSGRLRASIQHQVRTQGTKVVVRVGTDVEYAPFVHEGHGIIRPRRAKVLRFVPKGGNAFVFARQVRAVPAKPYLRKALDTLRISDLFG